MFSQLEQKHPGGIVAYTFAFMGLEVLLFTCLVGLLVSAWGGGVGEHGWFGLAWFLIQTRCLSGQLPLQFISVLAALFWRPSFPALNAWLATAASFLLWALLWAVSLFPSMTLSNNLEEAIGEVARFFVILLGFLVAAVVLISAALSGFLLGRVGANGRGGSGAGEGSEADGSTAESSADRTTKWM